MRWYVSIESNTVGPVEEAEVRRMGERGQLKPGTFVRDEASPGWVPLEQSPFAVLLFRAPEPSRPVAVRPEFVGAGLTLLGGLFIAWMWMPSDDASAPAKATASVARQTPAYERPQPKTVAQVVSESDTLRQALGVLKPHFTDTVEDIGAAEVLLINWSVEKLRWSEMMALPDSARKEVEKDPARFRGARLCNRGRVIQIATDRSAAKPVYSGIMSVGWTGYTRFVAVGSSSGVFEGSTVRFCGIVTGLNSYNTQAGGTNTAVFSVGMFDLPENL
jgi:hypothetical protein